MALADGCEPFSVDLTDDSGVQLGTPAIAAHPAQLEFEALSYGQLSSFTVSNTAGGLLTVQPLAYSGDAAFILLEPPDYVKLEAGESHDYEVYFEAVDREVSGTVAIRSDDPRKPLDTVTLLGEALVPELAVAPETWDFGTVAPGCESRVELVLENVGTANLDIDTMVYESEEALEARVDAQLPLALAPGAQLAVTVIFAPQREGSFEGRLTVSSNDLSEAYVATQTGDGSYDEWVSDSFQAYPPVDLLLMLDRSASMNDDLSRIGNRVELLLTALDAGGLHWWVGVGSQHHACLDGQLAQTGDEDPAATLRNAVLALLQAGTYAESLLLLASVAVENATTDTCNDGLLRSGAALHVVAVSDEADQSPGSYEIYLSALKEPLTDPALLVVSAVAGDYPSGCPSADPGSGYYEASVATDGSFISICSGLNELGSLADFSKRALVELRQEPVEETLEVSADGACWSEGWHYVADGNFVVFDSQPADVDTSEVRYVPAFECP